LYYHDDKQLFDERTVLIILREEVINYFIGYYKICIPHQTIGFNTKRFRYLWFVWNLQARSWHSWSAVNCGAWAGTVHSNSQKKGTSSLWNHLASNSLRQHEEPNLFRINSSKLHRLRLAGCPGFNSI